MIPVLKEHTVKKGEGMIGIMKRAGLDPKDWKTVYNMGYNRAALGRYKKVGHIEPGDKLWLPTMKNATFKDIESALFTIEDVLVALLDTYGTLRAEYWKLRSEKNDKVKAYELVKGNLGKYEKQLADAKKAQAECSKVNSKTGKPPGLGALTKCIVDAAPHRAVQSEFDYLRKRYKEVLADKKKAEAAFKKLDSLLDQREKLLKKAQDALREARNYFLKIQWQMYG